MRKIAFLVSFLTLAAALQAGEAAWLTNYDAATAQAKKEKKNILVEFTGSDWCPPCIQMKLEILSSKEFEAYADKNLILLELDYPAHKPQPESVARANELLSMKFLVEVFPTFLLLNPQGKELLRLQGYQPGGPAAFVKTLAAVKPPKSK